MKRLNDIKETKLGKEILRLVAITFAAAIAAFNLNSFVNQGGLIPGGFSGITVLVQRVFSTFLGKEIAYSLIYIPLNLIPVIIGFKNIGIRFTLYSLYEVLLSSILTDLFPVIHVTYDVLLIAIFGGLLSGISGGIIISMGACTGGTDFISIYYAEKKGINTWNYVFIFNVIILLTGGIIFGFDKALYSIIYQFVITQVLNTLDKRLQKDTLIVVTNKPIEVSKVISDLTKHASTLINDCEGAYTLDKRTIIYSVVGRKQVEKVTMEIKKIDPYAFINDIKTESINGNFYVEPR